MEGRYREEYARLESWKCKELLAVSGLRFVSDADRELQMASITANYVEYISELDACHRQEDSTRSLASLKPQEGQQHLLVLGEPQKDAGARSRDVQRPDVELKTKAEMKTNDGPCRWELLGNVVRPVTPTPNFLNCVSETFKRRDDGDNSPYAKRQRSTESASADIKTMMYSDVRKNAVDHNEWDTIIEWPEKSRQFWVCFCEEHKIHFKQKADLAAAKHLAGKLHEYPNRDRRPAMIALGHYIPDCTGELRKLHNAEVNEKYAAGYVPRNDHKREASGKDQIESSTQKLSQSAVTPCSQSPITHPKTSHIYYAKYKDQYWAVVILGWDRLPDGCRHSTLGASKLIKHDPPSCYNFDGYKRIIGWKPNYGDGSKSIWKREFPVMYFDKEKNYGWVPARDLSKFDLHRDIAPKRKNYPKASFHDARDWVAQRYGFKTWQALIRDNKGFHPAIPVSLESKPRGTTRVDPRNDALQSREDRGSSAPECDKSFPDKRTSTYTSMFSLPIRPFEETLKQLSPHPLAPQRTPLKTNIQDKPKAHPIPIARTLEDLVIMSPTMVPNPQPGRPMPTTHNPGPPAAEVSGATAPILAAPQIAPALPAAPVLGPPVIVPLLSAPSLQMPTPLTLTPHAQVASFRGSEASPLDAYEISAYKRRISEASASRKRPKVRTNATTQENVQKLPDAVPVLPEGIHDKEGMPGGLASEPGERRQSPGEGAVEETQCGPIDPRLLEPAGDAGVEDIALSPTADLPEADWEYGGVESNTSKPVMQYECHAFNKELDKYFSSLVQVMAG
ncbi:hypothetical protein PGQ11_007819 [Apiospora arundinis]|uniref:Uncharacterized protein n=1 Tax=Apiospora arundinis TaxID=335852 RepID=A0ABR2IWP3_9PEZI